MSWGRLPFGTAPFGSTVSGTTTVQVDSSLYGIATFNASAVVLKSSAWAVHGAAQCSFTATKISSVSGQITLTGYAQLIADAVSSLSTPTILAPGEDETLIQGTTRQVTWTASVDSFNQSVTYTLQHQPAGETAWYPLATGIEVTSFDTSVSVFGVGYHYLRVDATSSDGRVSFSDVRRFVSRAPNLQLSGCTMQGAASGMWGATALKSIKAICVVSGDASLLAAASGPVYSACTIIGDASFTGALVGPIYGTSTTQGVATVFARGSGPEYATLSCLGSSTLVSTLAGGVYTGAVILGRGSCQATGAGPVYVLPTEATVLRGDSTFDARTANLQGEALMFALSDLTANATGPEYAEVMMLGDSQTRHYEKHQKFTNFGEYAEGESLLTAGWVQSTFAFSGSSWVTESLAGANCGKVLSRTSTSLYSGAQDVLYYPQDGVWHRDQIVKTRLYLSSVNGVTGGVVARYGPSGYYAAALQDGQYLVILANGGILAQYFFPHEAGTPYNVVLECVGTYVRAKAWREGTPEPKWWPLEVQDSSFTEGSPGLFSYGASKIEYDILSYATEGALLLPEWWCSTEVLTHRLAAAPTNQYVEVEWRGTGISYRGAALAPADQTISPEVLGTPVVLPTSIYTEQ